MHKRVCLCVQSNRGAHYHLLAFFNRLAMTRHFDPGCSSSGVRHNEAFVRVCLCVCPALTELELFQGLKVFASQLEVPSATAAVKQKKTED